MDWSTKGTMTTILKDAKLVTFINILAVESNAMEHEGGRVVSDEHGESGGCRVGHDVERAKKGVAEASGFLIVRHVGARLEPHERLAAGGVERIHVAGDEVWGRGEVVSTLEEGHRDLDPRDDCPQVEALGWPSIRPCVTSIARRAWTA